MPKIDFEKLISPLKGLTYKFNGGYAYMPKRYNNYEGKSVNNQTGYAEIKNEETQSYTIENILAYNRDFGKHHLDLTALYAASRKKYQRSQAMASKFINDDQQWHNMGSAETPSVASYTDLYTTVSQMGRINYSYDSRYLFTFTVRRDGSSVFGDNNKYGVFPSILARSGCRRKDFNNLFLLSNYSLFNSLYSIKILCKINRLVGLFCKDKPFPRIMKKNRFQQVKFYHLSV